MSLHTEDLVNFSAGSRPQLIIMFARETGEAMIHCKELSDKVVRLVTIYEDGAYGPEVHIEFTDGTTFSACLKNNVSVEAKYIHDQGGEPSVLRDYTTPMISR